MIEQCRNKAGRSEYLPHAEEPNLALAVEKGEHAAHHLWSDFALSVRNSDRCRCHRRCHAMRVDFGEGPEAPCLAEVFHAGLDPYPTLGIPSGEFFVHVSYFTGWSTDVDKWIDARLRRAGWSLPGLWAVTRDSDWRHAKCSLCHPETSTGVLPASQ